MGSKSGGEITIYQHFMSMHIGVCAAGEGLEMVAIKVGEKEAWRGSCIDNQAIQIDQKDLFGGDRKEGGVAGQVCWLNGNEKQVLPEVLASKFGLTKDTCPGFRGLASAFFIGGTQSVDSDIFGDLIESNDAGFYWSANNPYLKAIAIRVRRAPKGLNPSIAMIRVADDANANAQWGANPGHIIFECMTNRDWGLGESYGAMNIASYEQAAQTLYDESFAMNMIWTRQSKIEDFVKEVLDHIQGAQFVDPATGKHTLKLLRAVDPEIAVPKISPDNAQLSSYKMKLWGDISNEIVVTWTNPETSKEETVSAQDLAAISMQGAQPASDSRNYYGIASQTLALDVAERDLAAVVHPIATLDAEVTKEFWRTVIYDVVELSWPERNIESAFFRVSQPSVGSTSNTVKLSLYEDIFSLDRASYIETSQTGWVNPSLNPEPLEFYQLGTAPAFMTSAALGLIDPGELIYPDAISAITIGPDSSDDISYELMGYVALTTGEIVQQSLGERELRGTWLTDVALAAQSMTLIAAMPGYMGARPETGQFVLIGMVDDEDTEIAVVRSVGSSGYLLDRGLLDTTPKAWPIGTRIWAIPTTNRVADPTPRVAFETASYHFLTRSSKGLLSIAEAPQMDILLSERPHLPNRPANVLVNGVGFGTADFGNLEEITVSWARRNRTNESTQVMRWTDGDMAPEIGQTTRLYLMKADRTPITTISGLTGTSTTVTRSDFAGDRAGIIRVVSVRDDMESLQGHEVAITIPEDILALSGDEAGNTLSLSGDMAPGNLIV